jgi:hypothetical protein
MHEPPGQVGIRVRAVLLLVLAVTIVTILVWRPWDSVPGELRGAAREASRLPGVAEVDIEHRETADIPARKFGPEPTEFEVSVRLDARLTPDGAAVAAERVHELLVPAAQAGARDDVTVFLRVTAGEPESINGVLVDPLEVRYSAASGVHDVADAFTIWQAGARSVNVYGLKSPVADARVDSEPGIAPDSPAGIGIEAAVAADMAPLAELAAGLGRSVNLHVTDSSTSYNGHNSVPHVDAVRLAVATASRPGVESVVFDNSFAPQLSVRAAWPAESAETQELRRWLEAHDYATKAGHPVAFTISEPGYATLTEGWVSAFAPPEPEPHPLPLPTGIEAWPDDADAPACTGADLDVSYGGSDAATGARYASLLARNVSDRPCAVEGIPDIVFCDADGAAQVEVRFEPYASGAVPARLVVPPGEQMLAPLQWRAMSTANDSDVTTSIQVVAVPGAEPALLDVTGHESSPTGLDVLDGADVHLGPWVQVLEGWS